MSTTKISDTSFDQDVLKAEGPVIVDFWAEWCGPCKSIGPALEEIAAEKQGAVTIAKLNIDDNPQTPQKYGVRGRTSRSNSYFLSICFTQRLFSGFYSVAFLALGWIGRLEPLPYDLGSAAKKCIPGRGFVFCLFLRV